MKCEIQWRSKYTFDGKIRDHAFITDIKVVAGGNDLGPSPKELLLASICGCTGMDVVGLLKKGRAQIDVLTIAADAEQTQEHPRVFSKVDITFNASGQESDAPVLIDAVQKSQNLYCGVSAMIAKSCPIHYKILLNDRLIFEGIADFPS
ncbi:MAG: OsmC family protein [Oligoflexales bacterium]